MKKPLKLSLYFAFFFGSILTNINDCNAQVNSSISEVDATALTLKGGVYGNIINGQNFQQEALKTHKGWQYITYYDVDRKVCIGRRKLPAGQWEILRFKDYSFSYAKGQMNDSHNTISMGFCIIDGTIHLAFDHHASPLHYRVSQKYVLDKPANFKWEASLFSPVLDQLESDVKITRMTYPRFVSTPSGNLQMGYRIGGSNNADYFMQSYDGKTGKWGSPFQVISGQGDYMDPFRGVSPTRNAYLNGLSYDKKGVLHLSWTWREVNQGVGNRDICYAYSADNGKTWKNTKGEVIGDASKKLMVNTNSKDVTIKELNRGWGLMNSQAQTTDAKGNFHVVMYHREQGADAGWARFKKDAAYFHYYRGANGDWKEQKIPFIGNRPKLLSDRRGNLYLVFIEKDHFDGKDQGAPLVVLKAEAKNKWKQWTKIYNSTLNYFNEPQVDFSGLEQNNVLSIMTQEVPVVEGGASKLSVHHIKIR